MGDATFFTGIRIYICAYVLARHYRYYCHLGKGGGGSLLYDKDEAIPTMFLLCPS